MGSLAGWGLDGWGAELKTVVAAPRISSLSADFSAFTCTRRSQVSGFSSQPLRTHCPLCVFQSPCFHLASVLIVCMCKEEGLPQACAIAFLEQLG